MLRPHVGQILVIDDLANRELDCDLPSDRYRGRVLDHAALLLGPSYALLAPESHEARRYVGPRRGPLSRVLIYCGGSDLTGEMVRALRVLQRPEFSHLSADVVVGPNTPGRDEIQEIAASRPSLTVHGQRDTLIELMIEADLALGGGGTTTWERCALGLPAIVAAVAPNQLPFNEALAAEGLIRFIGSAPEVEDEDLALALRGLSGDPEPLPELAARAWGVTDGGGTDRVVAALLGRESTAPARELGFPAGGRKLSILSDRDTWMNSHIATLVSGWRSEGHEVRWVHEAEALCLGDLAFLLGCSQIVKPERLALHDHTLVVHESDVPRGRGWSPMTWQVLEGASSYVVTLMEAVDDVDAGPVFLQTEVQLEGTELVDELRLLQANATLGLCRAFVSGYPDSGDHPREQEGTPTYYPRRRPDDSRLDPQKTLAEHFNLLRVVDNDRYPAFFDWQGKRYRLRIERSS